MKEYTYNIQNYIKNMKQINYSMLHLIVLLVILRLANMKLQNEKIYETNETNTTAYKRQALRK